MNVLRPGLCIAVAMIAVQAGMSSAAGAEGRASPHDVPIRSAVPYVDLHTHLDPRAPAAAVEAALRAMPAANAARIVFLPPPFTDGDGQRYDAQLLLAAVERHADRLAVFGGGGLLNPMLHEAVRTGDAGPAVQRHFREVAERLLRDGVAGFGELASEHFPGATPYQSAPPDHPLLMLLADVAAEHGVPIVLHMEAVPRPMPPPAGVASPPAPAELAPNVDALERLLAHNRGARVVWAHAGWDHTGMRTPALCRRLLRANANLYMDVKIDPVQPGRSSPVAGGRVEPEWLALFREFPDRFVVGTDQHYPQPRAATQRWQAAVAFLNQLPPELQRKIGFENATFLLSRAAR